VWGTNGRTTADRQECQSYLRAAHAAAPELEPGWTVKYTTDLTREVWYYLRGEEYSAQIDHFVKTIESGRTDNVNSFRSALQADRLVNMILAEGGGRAHAAPKVTASAKGFWSRMFG